MNGSKLVKVVNLQENLISWSQTNKILLSINTSALNAKLSCFSLNQFQHIRVNDLNVPALEPRWNCSMAAI